MSQTNSRGKRDGDDDGNRSKKRAAGSIAGGMSKRHVTAQGTAISREGGRKKTEMDRWVAERGGIPGGVNQTYPVRVELAEWCIDYGQEPCNVPFIWLISRWDVYYRLEKPAGRYIPTFSTAKMKFEVSTRVIKTLQYCPDTEYRVLVDLLTAATRHERYQKKAERKALLLKERRAQRQLMKRGGMSMSGMGGGKSESDHEDDDESKSLRVFDETGMGMKGEMELYDSKGGGSDLMPIGPTKKKNRNWRIQSLSTPQGTGVIVTDEDGRAQAPTPWGAPYAVDGFKESMLLGLAEFLESQLRNFMEGVGGIGDGGCPNLLNTPFMRMLRERTALRMETLQLVEAKRRALEVAKSLAEAASGHATPLGLDVTGMLSGDISGMPTGCSDYLGYNAGANGFSGRPPGAFFSSEMPVGGGYFQSNGMMGQGMMPGGMAADGIQALETEIHHLQQLLKDSEEDSEDEDEEDRCSRDDGSSSDNNDDRRGPGGGGMNHHQRIRPPDLQHHGGGSGANDHQRRNSNMMHHPAASESGFRLAPDGEMVEFHPGLTNERRGPRSLFRPRTGANLFRPRWFSDDFTENSQIQQLSDDYSLEGDGMEEEEESVSANRRGVSVEDFRESVGMTIASSSEEVDISKQRPSVQESIKPPEIDSVTAQPEHSNNSDDVLPPSSTDIPKNLQPSQSELNEENLPPQILQNESPTSHNSPPQFSTQRRDVQTSHQFQSQFPMQQQQSQFPQQYPFGPPMFGGLPNPSLLASMCLLPPPPFDQYLMSQSMSQSMPQSMELMGGDITGRPLNMFPGFNVWPQQYMQQIRAPQQREHHHHHRKTADRRSEEMAHQGPAKKRRVGNEKSPLVPVKSSGGHEFENDVGSPIGDPMKKRKRSLLNKSPKAKGFAVSMPPFPRDVSDDLDIAITDTKVSNGVIVLMMMFY